MEITRRASKGAVLNQLSMLAETFFLFLFSIVVARGLGATEWGVYSVIVSMSSMVILLSTIGLNEAINVFIPKLRDDKGRASFLFKRFLATRLITSVLAGGLYYILADRLAVLFGAPGLSYYFRLSVLYIIASNLSSLFMTYFIGRMDLKVVAIVRVVGGGVSLITVYIILRLGCGIAGIIVVSILVGLGILAAYVFKALSFLRIPGQRYSLSRVYHFGLALWLAAILEYVLGKQIDIILLQYFGIEAAQIGYYNIAFSMYRFLAAFILVGLGGIGLASISEISEKHGIESTANAWSILMKLSIVAIFPVIIFTIFHSQEIITTFYSDQFLGAAVMLQVAMLFYIPVRLLGGGTNISILYALGRERVVLYCRLIAGVSNLVLDCLLIPDHIGPVRCAGLGVMGAIVATMSTGMIMHIVEFVLAKRLIHMKYPYVFSFKIIGATLVAGQLTRRMGTEGLLSLLLACLVFSLIYVVLIMALRPLSNYDGEVMSRVMPGIVERLRRWNILIGNE